MMGDTIAAVSTAYGKGGIAVIRISGEDAVEVAARVFDGKGDLHTVAGGCTKRGNIVSNGRRIDDGIFTVFRKPRSFTGEDTVEISCHGGVLLTQRVLEAVFAAGARQASAGEFTRRAFCNGKLSLSQAEAVGLLIDASTDTQLSIAATQERGVFKKKADALYERLKTIVTSIYAVVDFPDEDLSELSAEEVYNGLVWLQNELKTLADSYHAVRAVMEGIRCAIVGKPNTGKSSLLNRLLGRDRAIVTDIAGTTRDTLEETVSVGQILLRLCDTAGIHDTADTVEKMGVERSLAALDAAELALAVFDTSRPFDSDDYALCERLKGFHGTVVAVLNKCDVAAVNTGDMLSAFPYRITLSASTGEGMERLQTLISDLFGAGKIDYDSQAVLLNARQNAAVAKALTAVESALTALKDGQTPDTVGFDLEEALSALSELDGRAVTEEIVGGIFHRFCVGK